MPERRFPEAFLEIGKDDDHSYMSLRTTRLPDGNLKIDVEGWGIAEHGLFLDIETGVILKLNIMGICGTVETETPIKVSFSHAVEKEEEKNVGAIEYPGYLPAEEGLIAVQLMLAKRNC